MSGRRRRRGPRTAAAAAAAAVVAMIAGAEATQATAHAGTPTWSLRTVLSRIDGARVRIGAWSGRVQAASTLCSGDGRGFRWSGTRHWRHFTCTWTVLDVHGGVDRDVTFRVHTLTAKRFAITNARFGAWP